MAEALNLQQLEKDLKAAGAPWEMDPQTSMAELTETERRRRLGFTPPPGEMQLEVAVERALKAPRITADQVRAEAITAPAKFDPRNIDGKNFTTPVKNQGGCGSCVAFGTAAVLETTARRQRNDPNLQLDLSEAHLFYCYAREEGRNCGNGWWPENALKKAQEKGVTFEQYFPYTAGDQGCGLLSGASDNIAKPTAFSKAGSRQAMKDWLSTKGSLTGCFVVFQDFFSYRSGVYRHVSGEAAGGHCVEIIGYDDGEACWICKNSWGTNWGEGGFFKIAYGECEIETWSGPFGVAGVSLKMWARNQRVSGLWTNNADRNAYAYLVGRGWRKLASSSVATQHAMLSQLITAKAASRSVDALEENNQIRQVYVV